MSDINHYGTSSRNRPSDPSIPSASGKFLEETRILGTSQSFIEIKFKVFKKNDPKGGPRSGSIAGDNFYMVDETANGGKGQAYLVLRKTYIESAEFSGVAIGARKGRISVVDPEGGWADAMNYIGAWKNATENIGRYNMIIEFGWIGLKEKDNTTASTQTIAAILLKTGFSMDDNGTVKIEINFIENIENLLNVIKFNELRDMILLDSSMNSKVKGKKIYEILKMMTTDSEGVKSQLKSYGLRINFAPTNEQGHDAYGEMGKDIKIRLGDTLGSKINECIASAMPPVKDDPKFTWSYEMVGKTIHNPAVDIGKDGYEHGVEYDIYFDWRKAPREDSNSTESEQKTAMAIGGKEPAQGPVLLWKKQSSNEGQKSLLSFDIDLKMLDYAASMVRSGLEKKLSSMTEKSWDGVFEAVKKIPKSNDAKNDVLSMSPDALATWVKDKNANRNPADSPVGIDSGVGGGFLFWGPDEKDRNTKQAVEEFNQILRDSASNVENQIQTIIKNNVFKAKAKIMGDPTIGTDNTVFLVGFTTDFEAVSSFANFFSRFWLLTSSIHKIEEGGYFTEIELMALPPKN